MPPSRHFTSLRLKVKLGLPNSQVRVEEDLEDLHLGLLMVEVLPWDDHLQEDQWDVVLLLVLHPQYTEPHLLV